MAAIILSGFRLAILPSHFRLCVFGSGEEGKEYHLPNYLRHHFGFSESQARLACRRCPSRPLSLDNAQNVLHLFRESGYTNDQMNKVIHGFPEILFRKSDSIKSKFEFFRSFGFSETELASVICIQPTILAYSLEQNLVPTIKYFEGILNGKANVIRALRRDPRLLGYNIERRTSVINVLLEIGIEGKSLVRLIKKCPRFRLNDSMKSYIEFVRNMGIAERSNQFVDALASLITVGSIEKIEEKFRVLEGFGLRKTDVIEIFRKYPLAFRVSKQKMEKNMEFLIEEAGFRPSILHTYPLFLLFSFEKRLKPRYQAFTYLKGSGPSYANLNLVTLLNMSNRRFIASYVTSSSHAEALLKILGLKGMKIAGAGENGAK